VSSDPIKDNNDLPPWLRDVPLPPRPRGLDEHAAPAQPAPPGPVVEPPAWLGAVPAEAGQAAPATPPADTPDWLGGESQPPTPAGTRNQSDLPDWLRDSQANQPASSGSTEQLPSWLQDITGTAAAPEPPSPDLPAAGPTSEANLPNWLRESQGDAPTAASEQLPDWLRDMAGDTPIQEEPAFSGEPTTWPQEQPTDAGPAEGEHIPDWLRDQHPDVPPPATQPGVFDDPFADLDRPSQPAADRGAAATNDSTTPNWLPDSSANAGEIDSTVEPFTFEESPGAASNAGTSSLPAWLGSGDDAEDTSATLPDWLRDTGGQAAGPNEPAAPADAPDWLADTSDLAAGPNEPAASTDAPDWLADTSNQAPVQNETPIGSPDVPLWLQDIDQRAADSAPATPSGPESAEPPIEAVPSWLQETPASQLPAETLPSWLQDTAPQPPTAESMPPWLQDSSAEQPVAESPAKDLPTWLHEAPTTETDEPATPPDATPSQPTPEPPEQDRLPDWLGPAGAAPAPASDAAQDIPPWLRDETGQPLPTAGVHGDTNLPAWLRGATIDRAPAAETSHPPVAPRSQPGSANFDWFADETAPALPQASANNANNELVGGIELPAWLRPPEPEQPKELNATDARSLDWLTRLGGHEEEESAGVVAAPAYKLKPPTAPARTPAQVEAIALLQHLAAQPYPEAEPTLAAQVPSIWRRFGLERLLYLAFLLILVVALALPLSGSIGLNTPPVALGAEELFAQIDRLNQNDTVLVGYEWDARRSGELRPLEQAVLGHLIEHKVKLVLVSTDAQGTLLLFDLRDKLGAAGYKPSGEDYILLGFKPGAELALRSIAQDFRGALRSDFQGNDATSSGLATNAGGQPRLNSLADFAMVLVLADEPIDVQGWMEQVHPSAKKADGSLVPFGFLLPAETAPIVQPYLGQLSIYHLAGKQGALTYQRLRGDKTAEQIGGEAGQQRLSLIVYIALFVIGAGAVGASSAMAPGRNRS